MNREYQMCTKCVMDTTDSHIVFDDNGVCDHCNTYHQKIEPFWNKDGNPEKLKEIVTQIKKWGGGEKEK